MMLGLALYESRLCDCGIHEDVLADKSNRFTIEVTRCSICADVTRWQRMQDAADERFRKSLGDNPPANRREPADGRKAHVVPVMPDSGEGAEPDPEPED